MLECVVNISEGRRAAVVASIAESAGRALLDLHLDPDHHRAVLTLVGEDAPRAVTVEAIRHLDVRTHHGAHPRIGVVDVVPFVPLAGADLDDAVAARDAFAQWAATELALPCFLYGPERSLPEIRRQAFRELAPDTGPPEPHPTAGAVAVGARRPLVAYNLWLRDADLTLARAVASALRSPVVRALGLAVGEAVQVSLNLLEPTAFGPAEAYDAVAARADIARAELVGLVPAGALDRVEPSRWEQLDLAPDRTIEARLAASGA